MRALVLTLAVLPALAGCKPPEQVETACEPERYTPLIGTNIAAVTLPADANVRVIAPGQAVTMDYRADRVNIETGDDGIILRVYCG